MVFLKYNIRLQVKIYIFHYLNNKAGNSFLILTQNNTNMSVHIYDINLVSCINLILILSYIAKYTEFYNWFIHI